MKIGLVHVGLGEVLEVQFNPEVGAKSELHIHYLRLLAHTMVQLDPVVVLIHEHDVAVDVGYQLQGHPEGSSEHRVLIFPIEDSVVIEK